MEKLVRESKNFSSCLGSFLSKSLMFPLPWNDTLALVQQYSIFFCNLCISTILYQICRKRLVEKLYFYQKRHLLEKLKSMINNDSRARLLRSWLKADWLQILVPLLTYHETWRNIRNLSHLICLVGILKSTSTL